jgi:hypothetical protein
MSTMGGEAGPVERFLGLAEASGGPFALLGLAVTEVSDAEVLAALERQIDRVSHHREGDTPSADEVRLALHAAAAQLLDRHVRRQLVTKWGGRAGAHAAQGVAGGASLIPQRPLELDAILTLGMFGGWNRRSLRRLLTLAHARGIGNHEVAATLSRLAGRRARWRRAPGGAVGGAEPAKRAVTAQPGAPVKQEAHAPQGAQASEPLEEQQDPAVAILKMAAGVTVLLAVLACVAGVLIWKAIESGRSHGPAGGGPVASLVEEGPVEHDSIFNRPAGVEPAGPPKGTESERKPERVDVGEVSMRLGQAVDGLAIDERQARADFLGGVAALSTGWVRMSESERIAAQQHVVEFVYRSANRADLSRDVIEAIALGSKRLVEGEIDKDGVLAATWSVGVLTRLSRERDLTALAEGLVRARLGDALGHSGGGLAGTYQSGATAALVAASQRLAAKSEQPVPTRLEAWEAWLDAADVVLTKGSAERERLVLGALETLLTRGPEPTEDKATFDAIGLLVSRLSWGDNAEAREWLVRWFADRRISAGDLNAVTMALVTKTRTPRVTQLMTLSPAASDGARADLRDQYATVWGLSESVKVEGLLADWASAARNALAIQPSTNVDRLEQAVRLSRLSEAAMLLWSGHSGEADALLEGLEAPLKMIRADASVTQGAGQSPGDKIVDGRWALRYLEAKRNIPVRMALLDEAAQRAGKFGTVDAEVIAQEAMYGSPREVKDKARRISLVHSSEWALVNGMLEDLPRVRGDDDTSDFLERMTLASLPPARSSEWDLAARRALTERLLELVAAGGEYAWVDALSRQLAASYEDRASSQPIPDQVPLTRNVSEAGASASNLWHSWRDAADRSNGFRGSRGALEELSGRRAGRLSLARGLVQTFAAEQVSVCEMMAYVVGGERPGASSTIELIMADLSDRRRRAMHIFEQLEAGERAMLRLWLVRLTEGAT